jgi:DNA repair exonuclease SbcCD nuclease subunit
MHNLFDKAVIFGDTHFGRNSNSPQANKDNLDFLRWAIDEARTWGAETCIMLGDWFHNRNLVGVETLHSALRGLEMVSEGFVHSYFITGNHDQFFRTRRDITSIEITKYIPNITLINDPLTLGDTTFLPWLMPDEHKTLNLSSRYVFAHLELSGFRSNTGHEMPESEHSQTTALFKQIEYCFTGHFHRRQHLKNVSYVGNIFPADFSDANDADRGIMLLQHGKEPEFRAWPQQPLYSTMTLTEMLSEPDRLLKQHMTVRATIDLPLRYEEAQEIRDSLITAYGLRKIEMINGVLETEQQFDPKVQFQSVDQIVLEGLSSVDSVELSPQRLIEIYASL